MSSLDTAAIHPATHYPGERLGNVSRAEASVISDFIDGDNLLFDEFIVYSVGFKFVFDDYLKIPIIALQDI